MKRLAQAVLSACLSLALMAGVSLTFTGCAADTLSGPDMELVGGDGDAGTGSSGSPHNTDKTDSGGDGDAGTGSSGSPHNTDG